MTHILHIDASMRTEGSVTRSLTADVIARLSAAAPNATVTRRDLSDGLPFLDADWIGANFTDEAKRTEAQRAALALSNTLVGELRDADTVVIGVPVYNFGIPAALKAWVDLIARARETFRYTENGPVGLLTGKRAVLVVASGGTEVDSAIDFATPYMRHVLGFVGIDDVTVIAADRQGAGADAALSRANDALDALAA